MIEDNPETSRVKLPFTFEVQLSSSLSFPNTITVILRLDGILLDKLPDNFSNNQLCIKIEYSTFEVLQSFKSNFFYVKVQERVTDKDWKVGIIFNICDNYYGLIQIAKDIRPGDIDSKTQMNISSLKNKSDYISSWKYKVDQHKSPENRQPSIAKFTMKPPRENGRHADKKLNGLGFSHQSESDPLQFLYSRYYGILYSLKTPLSYFPKTTISRFKNLCDNIPSSIKDNLLKLCISVSELDDRHSGKYGVLKTLSSEEIGSAHLKIKNQYEIQCQKDFLSKNQDLVTRLTKPFKSLNGDIANGSEDSDKKHNDLANDDRFSYVVELKVREAQLQILILMELLDSWETPEDVFLSTNIALQQKGDKEKRKNKKHSLVRRKATVSKKIVPTFLGMGVDVQENKALKTDSPGLDEFTLFETLNTLIDRMGLWDTLLDKSTGDKDDSSYGFLAYVLIPYFKQKLPLTLKHIIERIKGLNIKLNTKSKKKINEKSTKLMEVSSGRERDTKQTIASSKFEKTTIDPSKVPLLKKSSTNIATDLDLLPAFSLKRSKSTLSSRNLQKRQVDMSLNLKSFTENRDNLDKSLTLSRSFSERQGQEDRQIIFGNAKKYKSQPNILMKPPHETVAQVEATPSKPNLPPASFTTEITTPTNPKRHGNVIAKTPVDRFTSPSLTTSYKEMIAPYSSMRGKNSLTDRLVNEALAPPTHAIISSSPMISTTKPHIEGTMAEIVESSPIKSRVSPVNIQSSPFQTVSSNNKRKKPGEPISFEDLGFFDAGINGSPVSSTLNEFDEKNTGHIFKRTSLKRKKPQ